MPRQNTFRFKGKHAFLTYSQAPPDKLQEYFDFLKNLDYGQHNLVKLLVAHEFHADGGSHYHCYLMWDSQFTTRVTEFFDKYKHPNVQTCRSPKGVLKYCSKDKNWLAEEKKGEKWYNWDIPIKNKWADVYNAQTREEFDRLVGEVAPRDAIINFRQISAWAEQRFAVPTTYVPTFSREQFVELGPMTDWVNNELRGSKYVFYVTIPNSLRLPPPTNLNLTASVPLRLPNLSGSVLRTPQHSTKIPRTCR